MKLPLPNSALICLVFCFFFLVVALYCKLPDEIERLRYWTNQASKKYSNDPIIHEAWVRNTEISLKRLLR